jgi:hypothetical protein
LTPQARQTQLLSFPPRAAYGVMKAVMTAAFVANWH